MNRKGLITAGVLFVLIGLINIFTSRNVVIVALLLFFGFSLILSNLFTKQKKK